MRCLALAEQLRNQGARVLFISRDYPGNARGTIARRGFALACLPPRPDVEQPEAPMREWDEDADATAAALHHYAATNSWDWLLVDHYGLDGQWETHIARHVGMIGVIDDLANRTHQCHVLIDQNLHRGAVSRYAGLVPEHCCLYLGPRYALLRPEFAAARRQRWRTQFAVNRTVCVSFGGTDPTNTTVLVLRALQRAGLPNWHVDVIVSEGHRKLQEVKRAAKRRGNCTVHVNPPDVAQIVARADFAVGGAGVSLWERCCLGVPSILAAQAENQIGVAESAARSGVAAHLGRAIDVALSRWISVLQDWAVATRRRQAASRRAAALVDGAGAARIATYLTSSYVDQMNGPAERAPCAY